jgi:hypothetical protein
VGLGLGSGLGEKCFPRFRIAHYNAIYLSSYLLCYSTGRRRCANAAVAAEPKERLAITKKSAGERTEFEIDGTLFKLFAMYETTNAHGCAIIACAYYDMEMAAALGYDIEVIMLFLMPKFTCSLLLFNHLLF